MVISEDIVIYGMGQRGRTILELMELCGVPAGHIVDSNSELWGRAFGRYVVEPPDILQDGKGMQICITVASFLAVGDIRRMLRQDYRCSLDNEVPYCGLVMYLYGKIDTKSLIRKDKISYRDHTTVIFDCESGIALGGIEEWTKGICGKFLEEGGYGAYILTDNGKYSIPEELDGHILRVAIDNRKMFSLHNMEQILNRIAEYMPCIIVTSQPDQTLLAGKILRDASGGRVRVVSGIRGGYAEISRSYMEMRDCTDMYVCVNSAIRKDLVEKGVRPEHVHTMLCPVECPDVLKRSYSLDAAAPVRIGFAGRLEKEQKRMDLMLNVIEILEEMQVHYCLEFAGEGSYGEKIKDFIKEHKCDGKIKLLGKIDKTAIREFWKDKDICINISDYEGRSRSTIEAMANGAVPVVTETWGVYDDIADGKNGFIVGVGDCKAMAEKISLLDRERDRLPEMGQRAHEELKRKSSMDDHYRFWQKIIGLAKAGGQEEFDGRADRNGNGRCKN